MWYTIVTKNPFEIWPMNTIQKVTQKGRQGNLILPNSLVD